MYSKRQKIYINSTQPLWLGSPVRGRGEPGLTSRLARMHAQLNLCEWWAGTHVHAARRKIELHTCARGDTAQRTLLGIGHSSVMGCDPRVRDPWFISSEEKPEYCFSLLHTNLCAPIFGVPLRGRWTLAPLWGSFKIFIINK